MLEYIKKENKSKTPRVITYLLDILVNSKKFFITLVTLTVVGIIASSTAVFIYSKDPMDLLEVSPLFVSIVIMRFNSRAMRIGLLMGGINSILYAVVYYSMGYFSNALSCIVISFPIQIMTFILWSRRKSGLTTKFRNFTRKQRLLLYAGFIAVYIPWLIIDIKIGAASPIFDAATSLLGFISPFITAFAFIDYTYLSFAGCVLSVLMHAMNIAGDPAQIPFLIYSIYSTICTVICIFNVRALYLTQQELKKKGL